MSRRWLAAFFTGLFLCMVLLFSLHSALGFGDFDSDTDFGGGSDYGGSDYGDYGGSDYDYSGGGSRSSGRSSDDPVAVIIVLGLLCGIGFLFSGIDKRRKNTGGQRTASPQRKQETKINRMPMETDAYRELRETRDPDYTEEGLFSYIRKLFREMQDGWEAGDISGVQYGFLPDTWQRFATQLKMKNQRGETTHVRDISFGGLEVTGFRALSGENRDKIQVRFKVAYNVWVTDKDGKNIQGSPETRHLMTYLWTMERPHNAKTEGAPADASHCPNCGAELEVAAFAECPFCHTQLYRETANWVIRDIQAESQVTVR